MMAIALRDLHPSLRRISIIPQAPKIGRPFSKSSTVSSLAKPTMSSTSLADAHLNHSSGT